MDPDRAKDWLGWAVSLGTIGYALGKFAAGSLTDLLGGRRNYLIGMAGAVACTMRPRDWGARCRSSRWSGSPTG